MDRQEPLIGKERAGKRGFAVQAIVLTALMVTMFAGLLYLSDKGSRNIPFAWERAFSEQIPMPFSRGQGALSEAWSNDLQKLVDDLAREMDMPEDIVIHVNYSPRSEINAVAVMGGEVYVFNGLINMARSENALSFVLAHEIAHLKHRHGLRGVSRQSVISSAILMLFGTSGDVSDVANTTSLLSGLKYSRDMETQADEEAVHALARHYGHVGGMTQIFDDFERMTRNSQQAPEILQSHPNFTTRLAHMKSLAEESGYALQGPLTPIALSNGRNGRACDKAMTLCRIENSIERIRMSLVEDDVAAAGESK